MNKNATLLCFFGGSNNQAQRLARRDFIAIMAPSTIFSCDFDSQRWSFYLKIWYNAAADSRGENLVKRPDPLQHRWERNRLRGRDSEKLREREKEEGRGQKKKKRFTLPMTNQSWKFALPVVIHCHSYLESRLLW